MLGLGSVVGRLGTSSKCNKQYQMKVFRVLGIELVIISSLVIAFVGFLSNCCLFDLLCILADV